MKAFLFVVLLFVIVLFCCANRQTIKRTRRAAYDLSDGWYDLIDSVNPSFACFADGYFADVDNGCQIYHVCHTIDKGYGKPQIMQYSFICPNNTVFDQSMLVCNHVEDSIPCDSSPDFYYLNNRIGDPQVYFLYDEDIELASRYTSGNRFGDRKVSQTVPQEDTLIENNVELQNYDTTIDDS